VRRKRELDRHRSPLIAERKLDEGAYVIDILQQPAAVRRSTDGTIRLTPRYYCEHGFAPALRAGAVEPALEELMRALSHLKQIG
jgi:DNA-binding FrmR family transcriptional regulator